MSFNQADPRATSGRNEGFDINANDTGTFPGDQGNVSASDYDQSDPQFGNVARGTAGFDTTNTTASGDFGQSQDWSTRANAGSDFGNSQPSGTATGDDYGTLPRDVAGNARSWRGPGQDVQQNSDQDWQQQQQGSDNWNRTSGSAGSGQNDDQWDDSNAQGGQGSKPGFGDKMMGQAEKTLGSVTRNQGMKERGMERKAGDL